MTTLSSNITWFGRPATVSCDGRCDKAWGVNGRPCRPFDDAADDDDFEWLADDELGTAPADPGTREGDDAKPRAVGEAHNKWCARECERSVVVAGHDAIVQLDDWSERRPNKADRMSDDQIARVRARRGATARSLELQRRRPDR